MVDVLSVLTRVSMARRALGCPFCPRIPYLPAVSRHARLMPDGRFCLFAHGIALPALTPIDTLQRRFEHWLFDLPEEVGGRTLHLVVVPLRFLYALLRDFIRGDLGLRAMSLVYSSLFALVPVIAVAFSVLKAFGYHRQLEPVLFEFLRPLGVRGYELTANIMKFVENAQTTLLGTVGFAFLLYTVITMIQKVESSLNFTWHVERPRSLTKRITEYGVVMLVGPAVAVVAMVLLARFEASDVMSRVSGFATGNDE